MKFIVNWLVVVGVCITLLGLWGLFRWTFQGIHDLSDGISACVRTVTGSSWIMIAMGLYRVDHQIFIKRNEIEEAHSTRIREFFGINHDTANRESGNIHLDPKDESRRHIDDQ